MKRVLVIGAGPAGSAAAMSMQRYKGLEVEMLDRATFPRKKACGSGLSPWCLELLEEMGVGEQVRKEAFAVGAARIGGSRGEVFELRSDYEAAVLLRERFDHLLVQEAQKRGALLCDGVRVLEIVRERGEVIGVRTSEGEREADAVIVANGAKTTFAKERRPGAFLQTYMAWYEGVEDIIDAVELYFDPVVKPFYGWVFPESPSRVNIGIVFAPRKGTPNAKERFLEFMETRLGSRMRGASQIDKPIGHPIATSYRPTRLSQQGLLVAGEAGQLVDPATAEGIHHALASGWVAGEHLGELEAQGASFSAANLSPYTGMIRDKIGYRLLAGQGLLQLARTPLFDWMMAFGNLKPVRSLLHWALTGA